MGSKCQRKVQSAQVKLLLFFLFQSARLRAAGFGKDFKENPNLRDNWTDAEGYYRKLCLSVYKDR